jgi:hypothetical protein
MTIQKQFAYHKPSVLGLADIQKLREAFSALDEVIRHVCPDSRERNVALTELETSAMWAVKSVVYNDPLSEVTV